MYFRHLFTFFNYTNNPLTHLLTYSIVSFNWPILIGPIPWGHSCPLCHALVVVVVVVVVVVDVVVDIDEQAACDSTASDIC